MVLCGIWWSRPIQHYFLSFSRVLLLYKTKLWSRSSLITRLITEYLVGLRFKLFFLHIRRILYLFKYWFDSLMRKPLFGTVIIHLMCMHNNAENQRRKVLLRRDSGKASNSKRLQRLDAWISILIVRRVRYFVNNKSTFVIVTLHYQRRTIRRTADHSQTCAGSGTTKYYAYKPKFCSRDLRHRIIKRWCKIVYSITPFLSVAFSVLRYN